MSSLRPVIVASHERSGTHFLMNTLALNFGYDSRRFISNDVTTGADFYDRNSLYRYLASLRVVARGRTIKEHHHFGFFDGLEPYLRAEFAVFYIVRNPADALCSFWRYVCTAKRSEGTATASPGAFLRTPPSAGMLRYQIEQHPTVLARWRSHVEAWTGKAAAAAGIAVIRYEDLNLDFAATVERLGRHLGVASAEPVRPSLTDNVILSGPGRVGGYRELLDPADVAHIRREAGSVLDRLGYAELR